MPKLTSTARTDRFGIFVQKLSYAIEAETDEPALLSRCADALEWLIAEDAWLPDVYRRPDLQHYQQYLLYCNPQKRFSVVSFVWGPGQATPIHNHGTWGVIGILHGAEISQRFCMQDDGTLSLDGSAYTLRKGDIETLSPHKGDIHQVRNGLDDEASIAIHIYGADIGSVSRYTYTLDGNRKPFISHYTNGSMPSLWLHDDV